MCISAPGKIIKIEGRRAKVQYPTEVRYALIGDEKVTIGDYVFVQMGIIIQKVTKKENLTSSMAWLGR